MIRKKLLMLGLALVTLNLYSCTKDNNSSSSSGTAQVSMHLTDGPGSYDEVNLDIQEVDITMTDSTKVTLTPIHAGVYDLLKLRNGLDTLLGRATIPAGTIGQIRLVLGSNNTVVIGGTSYALTTPSGQQSGVKLNLNQTFAAGGSYDIWLDFDAGKSIVEAGSSGKYILKPVIRAYSSLTNGQIKGYVMPLGSLTTVYAINGTDTFTAIPASLDGFFMISGLPAASYNVWFNAGLVSLSDTTIASVGVTYGAITDLGTITLHP